jgi:hypothetical protein
MTISMAFYSTEAAELESVIDAIDGFDVTCAASMYGIRISDAAGAVIATVLPSAHSLVPASVARCFPLASAPTLPGYITEFIGDAELGEVIVEELDGVVLERSDHGA